VPRALVLALLLTAGAAHADDFTPIPKRSFAIALAMHASHSGALEEGGAGANIELARGRDRHQLFAELGLAVIGVSAASGAGTSARAALGARYLLRSITVDEAAFDLVTEAALGGEVLAWSTGTRIRPQAAIGLGWQVRTRTHEDKKFAIRVVTRLFVTTRGDEMAPATTARSNDYGFIGLFGAAW